MKMIPRTRVQMNIWKRCRLMPSASLRTSCTKPRDVVGSAWDGVVALILVDQRRADGRPGADADQRQHRARDGVQLVVDHPDEDIRDYHQAEPERHLKERER